MIQIRPFTFTPSDYEKAIAFRNQLTPDSPTTTEIWQHSDKKRPFASTFYRALCFDESEQLIGYGECSKISEQSHKFFINLQLELDLWGTAVSDSLYTHLLEKIQTSAATHIITDLRESQTEKHAFLKTKGFKQISRAPVSHLDVQSFKVGPLKGMLKKAILSQIIVKQLPTTWAIDEKQQRRVFELYWAILQDIPHHEKRNESEFMDFFHAEITHPNFLPEGHFVALDKGKMVGMSNLVKQGGSTKQLATDITGVLQSHRRRGIATMLKVAAIQYAQSINTELLITNNEENSPMFRLNQALGFKPQPAWLTMVAKIGD